MERRRTATDSAPDKISLNEVLTIYLVLRNVSERTLRISLPPHPDILSFRRNGTTISYSVNKEDGPMSFWKLRPGHQALIPSPPIQLLAPGDLGLNGALTELKPGPHTMHARVGSGGYRWVPAEDGTSRKFFPRKGEWTGYLSPPRHPIEVLAEKAPFDIGPLEDLPDGHGLKHIMGRPPSLSHGHTEWIQLRDGLEFGLDSSQDAHWLLDYGTYNRPLAWGPIPAAKLKDLRLLDPIRRLSHEHIQTADHQHQADYRIGVLVRSQQPLADMGLNLVRTMPLPEPQGHIPSDDLVRTIRDRRVELENMGLAAPMQRALERLTRKDAPMPDDAEFRVVSSKKLPDRLEEKSWGPKNAGLQAAALMPDSVSAGTTENVRLFIRNVSKQDVRLAVSQRAGYDYATAVDGDGNRLTTIRPYVYPAAFSSMIVPEIDPGQTTQTPPTATLQKVRLKPDAVLELATPTGLVLDDCETGTGDSLGMHPEGGAVAVTHINTKATTARVTWHLHAANGATYSRDLRRRLWPARGSWSGILTTAPAEIQLRH